MSSSAVSSLASAFAGLTGLSAFSLVVVHLREAVRKVDHDAAAADHENIDHRAYLSAIPFVNGDAGEALR